MTLQQPLLALEEPLKCFLASAEPPAGGGGAGGGEAEGGGGTSWGVEPRLSDVAPQISIERKSS
jgi:hypothetical protein